jgi:protein-tyrosine phosphatase
MPWPFSKKAPKPPGFRELAPAGLFDLHGHALWGVDDGAADPAESMAILDGLAGLGYRGVALTRHHNHPMFQNTSEAVVDARARELQLARGDRPPALVIGAEIMIDERFVPELEAGALPCTAAPGIHLVEFAYGEGAVPGGFEELVFRQQVRGVTLIVAHAERYPDLQRDQARLAAIARAGALIQVNLMSLSGRYGRRTARTAWDLIAAGLADLVGSDLHHAVDLPIVAEGLAELARNEPAELVRLASTNPGLLLAGKPFEVERRE